MTVVSKTNRVSVRDFLFSDSQQLFGIDGYALPKYSWKKPKFSMGMDKKLDYISLIAEEKPDLNFTKVFVKKKHEVPGPTKYETIYNWKKNPKGKWLKGERKTVIQ